MADYVVLTDMGAEINIKFSHQDMTRFFAIKDDLKQCVPGARFDKDTKSWFAWKGSWRHICRWAARWYPLSSIINNTNYSINLGDDDTGQQRKSAPGKGSDVDEAYKALHLVPGAPDWAVQSMARASTRKYHPDAGGSHADMVRINAAVEVLRKAGVV